MKPNIKKIDILLLRREMQNVALQINNYTQEEIIDLLFRAIDLIDGLRGNQKTYRQIVGFNKDLLNKEVRILTKQSLTMDKSAVNQKISMLESLIDTFLKETGK